MVNHMKKFCKNKDVVDKTAVLEQQILELKKKVDILENNKTTINGNVNNGTVNNTINNTNIQSENKVKSEKKFTCRFCNHMFTRKNNMVMHIKEKCKLADKDKYEKDELKNKVLELTKVVHQLQAKTK